MTRTRRTQSTCGKGGLHYWRRLAFAPSAVPIFHKSLRVGGKQLTVKTGCRANIHPCRHPIEQQSPIEQWSSTAVSRWDALREYAIDSVEILRHRHVGRCFIFFVERQRLPHQRPTLDSSIGFSMRSTSRIRKAFGWRGRTVFHAAREEMKSSSEPGCGHNAISLANRIPKGRHAEAVPSLRNFPTAAKHLPAWSVNRKNAREVSMPVGATQS
jgi:hypothetical protein